MLFRVFLTKKRVPDVFLSTTEYERKLIQFADTVDSGSVFINQSI